MAKRAPAEDAVYNPLDVNLAHAVIQGAGALPTARSPGGVVKGNVPNRLPDPQPAQDGAIVAVPGRAKTPPNSVGRRSTGREKRVLLTPEEELQVERLVDRLGEQLGNSVKLSHVLRGCIAVLCHSEAELLHRAAEMRPLQRPANGNAVALAQFEQALARLLSKALRDAPPLR